MCTAVETSTVMLPLLSGRGTSMISNDGMSVCGRIFAARCLAFSCR